jgi:hypothetical protein
MKSFIDKKDTAIGFCISGLTPTSKDYVMSTKLFTCASTINEAISIAVKTLKVDIKRVEITGKKTNKLYYVLEKIGNSSDLIANELGLLKSKAIANVSIID